jgi:hypothetical protein
VTTCGGSSGGGATSDAASAMGYTARSGPRAGRRDSGTLRLCVLTGGLCDGLVCQAAARCVRGAWQRRVRRLRRRRRKTARRFTPVE